MAPAAPSVDVQVQPQPVPLQYVVGQQPMADGSVSVLLQLFSPVGQAVYFLPHDFAARLGAELTRLAGPAATGLIVAG